MDMELLARLKSWGQGENGCFRVARERLSTRIISAVVSLNRLRRIWESHYAVGTISDSAWQPSFGAAGLTLK